MIGMTAELYCAYLPRVRQNGDSGRKVWSCAYFCCTTKEQKIKWVGGCHDSHVSAVSAMSAMSLTHRFTNAASRIMVRYCVMLCYDGDSSVPLRIHLMASFSFRFRASDISGHNISRITTILSDIFERPCHVSDELTRPSTTLLPRFEKEDGKGHDRMIFKSNAGHHVGRIRKGHLDCISRTRSWT